MRISGVVVTLSLAFGGLDALGAGPSFTRDVRPLFAEKCYACHGPDAGTRKMGLRLDRIPDAIVSGVIVPGDAASSYLVRKIRSDNPRTVMPPPSSKKVLSAAEVQLVVDWIDSGADFEPHWSFQTIPNSSPPSVADGEDWIRQPIDAFVLSRLKEEGLSPAHEADRETLLRRVTLDLTGLPPSLKEMDAYLADTSPGAYQRIVDRLLASPRYGEHMASGWLDVARYADTFGYQNDKENHVWPWRDWVIRAYNRNLPYDVFVTQQLAGDLLPDATPDQRLATAFNRLHRQTNEGGSVEEEFRLEYVADRTETFGTAFLGLTLECARCHDHKFDPITQQEFYQVSAFFSSIDESGTYSHFTEATPTPALPLFEPGQEEELNRMRGFTTLRREQWDDARRQAGQRYRRWRNQNTGFFRVRSPILHLTFDTPPVDKRLENAADPSHAGRVTDHYTSSPGVFQGGTHFDGDNGITIDEIGDFDRFHPFSLSMWLHSALEEPKMVVCHRSKASLDAASRGYEVLIKDGRLTFGLIHFWPGNALRVQALKALPADRWVHVAITYDGSSRAQGVTLFVDGQPLEARTIRDGLSRTLLYPASTEVSVTLGARFRDPGFTGGCMDEFQLYDGALSRLEVEALAAPSGTESFLKTVSRDPGFEPLLREHYIDVFDPEVRVHRAWLTQARAQEARLFDSVRQVMVMQETAVPRATYLLERGDYRRKAARAALDTPALLPEFPGGAPRNRLGLARWLFDPRHPLTARVAVNRLWQQLFGRGLVPTPEDFGIQGDPSLHPELLDHLAIRYRQSGWDTKAMLREMVLSATYRQSSTAGPSLTERDPDNALLARGPSHRLSAEAIRDAALRASGLLSEKVGGPSVKPYQPPGLWKDASQITYEPDSGAALYRRSLYTHIKRTVPPPSMLTFDATNRETCVVSRERTRTPLQALVLLNDPQFVEASRVLAQHSLAAEVSVDPALRRIFRALTSRAPESRQMELLRETYREQKRWFESKPDQAVSYLAVGEFPNHSNVDTTDLAALTAVAQMVMNFDTFQMKR